MSRHYNNHGISKTRVYHIYKGMINRCYNPHNESDRKYYYDKGITVCDEWRNNIKAFYEWAMNNGYDDNLTIDGIDNNKGYSPTNCRWITQYEQNKNRSCSVNIKYKGEIKTIPEWVAELNLKVPRSTINYRLTTLGWDVEDAFYTPKGESKGSKLRKWFADHGVYAVGVIKGGK